VERAAKEIRKQVIRKANSQSKVKSLLVFIDVPPGDWIFY
jgi:hypothetical protein